jgi:hypothetical protein
VTLSRQARRAPSTHLKRLHSPGDAYPDTDHRRPALRGQQGGRRRQSAGIRRWPCSWRRAGSLRSWPRDLTRHQSRARDGSAAPGPRTRARRRAGPVGPPGRRLSGRWRRPPRRWRKGRRLGSREPALPSCLRGYSPRHRVAALLRPRGAANVLCAPPTRNSLCAGTFAWERFGAARRCACRVLLRLS